MENTPVGLSAEEREQLIAPRDNDEPLDVTLSLLAFVSLLLILIMLVVASFVAR